MAVGDPRSFVEARSSALLRLAYLLVGDRQEAEDITQSTLVEVVARWDRIRRRDVPEVYARQVMVNLATRSWRRRALHLRSLARLGPPPPSADHAAPTVLAHDLQTALRTLPPRMRAVIVLRYYEDLTEAQTARVLGVSAGTVKSQANRALRQLRVRLGDTYEPAPREVESIEKGQP